MKNRSGIIEIEQMVSYCTGCLNNHGKIGENVMLPEKIFSLERGLGTKDTKLHITCILPDQFSNFILSEEGVLQKNCTQHSSLIFSHTIVVLSIIPRLLLFLRHPMEYI